MFFRGKDAVHKTLRRLVKRLERADIPYVIVGGMALNAHRYQRTTRDVDVLLSAAGFAEFRRRFEGENYQLVPGQRRRFIDRTNQVTLEVLASGLFPGSGKPGPIAFPDPQHVAKRIDDIQVVNLATLVQLKLAAGRHRDFGDVVELIRIHNLNEEFADHLHASIQRDFIECLEEKRREDEYQARQG